MSNKFLKIQKGVRLEPQASSSASQKGSLEVLDSTSELYFHDGTSARKVAHENNTITLSNKTLASPVLSGTTTSVGESLVLTAAATYNIDLNTSGGGTIDLNGVSVTDAGVLNTSNNVNITGSAVLDAANATIQNSLVLPPDNVSISSNTITITSPYVRITGGTGDLSDITSTTSGSVAIVTNIRGSSLNILNNANIVTGTGSTLVLENDASIVIVRDGTTGAWRIVGGSGGMTALTGQALTDGTILMGNGSNLSAEVTVSGDATISNAGVLTIANSAVTNAKVATGIDAAKIADGSVSNTEFQYLDGVTSAIQTQLDGKAATSHTHTASDITDFTSAAKTAVVDDSITDGITDKAPSQNAVFDALALKADSSTLSNYVAKAGSTMDSNADLTFQGGGEVLGLPATPSGSTAAASKAYVDAVVQGIKPKQAVRLATTANIDLSTELENGDYIDSVQLLTGDRVLVKDQTASETNGIYIVQATGAAVRATDFDSLSPIDEINGAYVAVQTGAVNGGKVFVQTSNVTTLETDPITFTFFNAIGTLTGGNGIDITGSTVSVDHDGDGLQFNGTQLSLELDGSTLSKSASGLKISSAGVTEVELNSSVAGNGLTGGGGTALAVGAGNGISVAANDVSVSADATGGANLAKAINVSSNGVAVKVDDSTVEGDATTGQLRVKSGGITNTQVSASAAIAESKLSLDYSTSSLNTGISDNATDIGDLVTLSGVAANSTDLGTFTGTTIADNQTVKQALQALETSVETKVTAVSGDLNGSFSFADNQPTAQNITGLAFAAGSVRAFEAIVSVDRSGDGTFETFKVLGIQTSADFEITVTGVGDDTGVDLSITSAGQMQYTSTSTGNGGTIKFRAQVLAV